MQNESVTGWIHQLSDGNQQAAEQLWERFSVQLREFALQRLDPQILRSYDEDDAANSAFHSLCRGIVGGRIEVGNRDAFWGLLAVITARKISAQRRDSRRLKRGEGAQRGGSAFGDLGIKRGRWSPAAARNYFRNF